MFEDWKRERLIKSTLARLARLRVALIFQPGNYWVIEQAVSEEDDPHVAAALRTAQLRGWVAIELNAVPTGKLAPDGSLPKGALLTGSGPVYRLTEAGWAVINNSHAWIVATFMMASVTLLATVIGVFLSLPR